MTSTTSCNAIQERIVVGDILDEASQEHVLVCASCGRLTAEWVALDGLVAHGLAGGIAVPDGFADRVMDRIESQPAADSRIQSLLGRRWVQLALTQVGLAVAIANLLRFVFSTLVPAASLGSVP
ncbi:MAG TPA: hypothetical protein VF550_14400 [Polyangia bacterium]